MSVFARLLKLTQPPCDTSACGAGCDQEDSGVGRRVQCLQQRAGRPSPLLSLHLDDLAIVPLFTSFPSKPCVYNGPLGLSAMFSPPQQGAGNTSVKSPRSHRSEGVQHCESSATETRADDLVAVWAEGAVWRVQVRTQTLVKSAIVQVDATPFKQFYAQHYGVEAGIKKRSGAAAAAEEEKKAGEEAKKTSNHVDRKLKLRNQTRKLDEVRLLLTSIVQCSTNHRRSQKARRGW